MKALRVLKYVGFGILGIAFVILVIFGVQALWNWLIPGLFNGPVLNLLANSRIIPPVKDPAYGYCTRR